MRILISTLIASMALSPLAGAKVNEGEETLSPPLATHAVLFTVDADGTGRPACAIDVSGHPELVPGGLTVAESGTSDFKSSHQICDEEQMKAITQIVSEPLEHKVAAVAAVPPLIGSICLANFAISTAIVVAANLSNNRMLSDNASGFALGFGTGAGAMRGIDLASKLGMGAVGFACSAAGAYVGYYIVPAPRR